MGIKHMYIYIPQELIQLLLFARECFKIPTYKFFINFIWCLLVAEGKKTTRNIHRYCFFCKKNLSSWERFLSQYKWPFMEVMKKLFMLLVDTFPDQFLTFGAFNIAYDTSLMSKNSKKIPGIQKWRDHSGNADSGEYITGHHWGILGLVGKFFGKRYMCFPLIFRLISGKSQMFQWICTDKGVAEPMNFWHNAHAAILQFAGWAAGHRVRVVADAYFSNEKFIKELIGQPGPIHVVTRLRSNTVAYEDPAIPETPKRGRPCKKGRKFKVVDLFRTEPKVSLEAQLYGTTATVEAVVKDLWLLGLPQKARIVVTKVGGKVNAFVSTDMSLSGGQIIEIYGSRFSIETAIRDMKQHLGLEDYQHQSLLSAMRFLHLVAVAYGVGRILLIKHGRCSWLEINGGEGDTPWTSELSFKKLRICLRRFSMGKLVFSNTALDAEVAENTTVKDAILAIAS
jgi:hypothetical protein